MELSGKQQWLMSLEKQRDMKELSAGPVEARPLGGKNVLHRGGNTWRRGCNPVWEESRSGLCDVTPWGWVDTEFWSVCAECLTQVHAHLSKSYLSKVGVWLAPPKPPPHSPVGRPNLRGICFPDSRQLVVCT